MENDAALGGRLLRTREVTDLLGVHRNTLHRLVERGGLRPVKVGQQLRYRPEDVQRFMREGEHPATTTGAASA
jgi:excisionase family DNA binding protein